MNLWQALCYYGAWIVIAFFALTWCKAFGWLIFPKLRDHILLSIPAGLGSGAIWYMVVIETTPQLS